MKCRSKSKKPVPLTLEQRIRKINNAIYRLGDNEHALNEIKGFLLSRIMELLWGKLGKRKKWFIK